MKISPRKSRSENRLRKIKKLGAQRSAPQTSTGLYVRSEGGIRMRDERVAQLARRVMKVCSWLSPTDLPSVRAWCQLELLGDAAYMILKDKGITSDGTNPRRLLTDFRQLRLAQLIHANALGLTPLAREQIKGTRDANAFDIAKLASQIDESNGAASSTTSDDDGSTAS